MVRLVEKITANKKNFIFLGEAGSGKSEIAVNFAFYLAKLNRKEVHFFDLDMTKTLFRSRDLKREIERMGIILHFEEQFMDAPTTTGGITRCLKDENCYVVMDVGGDSVGARAVGGYAQGLNRSNTVAYCVLNSYRPWSYDINQIDQTIGSILSVSHISLDQIHLINNPNIGCGTTAEDFLEGSRKMEEMVNPFKMVDFSCVRTELYEEIRQRQSGEILPIHLYLTYPWVEQAG